MHRYIKEIDRERFEELKESKYTYFENHCVINIFDDGLNAFETPDGCKYEVCIGGQDEHGQSTGKNQA